MKGYFFIADLLGFSRIIENLADDQLETRISAWVDLVESSAATHGIRNFQLISDTLFAATDSSAAGLKQIIDFSQCLLSKGLEKSFPIRGAVSHGGYEWGKLTYGKAVIMGHQLEMNQNWIGVGCSNDLPHLTNAWGLDSVVCYPLPMKRGPVRLHPVVVWNVPELKTMTSLICREGLTRQGDVLGWEWSQKVDNTIQFRMYLHILRTLNGSPSQFYGTSPLEVLELNLFRNQSP